MRWDGGRRIGAGVRLPLVDLLHLLQDVGLFLGRQAGEVFKDGAQLVEDGGEVDGHPPAGHRGGSAAGGLQVGGRKGDDLVLDGQALGEAGADDDQIEIHGGRVTAKMRPNFAAPVDGRETG